MEKISIFSAVYLILSFSATLVLYVMAGKKYRAMVEPLDKKDYGLRDFFPIGFQVMDMIHYPYNSGFDRKLLRSCGSCSTRILRIIICGFTGRAPRAICSWD